MWEDLYTSLASNDVNWVIFGDFNAVRSREEKVGASFSVRDARAFNDFIARAGLMDIPLGDRRSTRFNKQGEIKEMKEMIENGAKTVTFQNNFGFDTIHRTKYGRHFFS